MVEPVYKSEEWLIEQYVVNEQSCKQIGKKANVNHKTISNWLRKYGISIRPRQWYYDRMKSPHWTELPEGATKVCTKCGNEYLATLDFFSANNKIGLGLTSWCRVCVAEYHQEYRTNSHNCKVISCRKFGISVEEYDAFLEKQNNVCAICGSQPSPNNGKQMFAVDHDHETGNVRGLLCTRCNPMLGFAKDNPETLLKAAQYLKKHKEND